MNGKRPPSHATPTKQLTRNSNELRQNVCASAFKRVRERVSEENRCPNTAQNLWNAVIVATLFLRPTSQLHSVYQIRLCVARSLA